MIKEKIYIFDTTLRDGAQTEGVDFSIEDKNKIANVLSNIGIDYTRRDRVVNHVFKQGSLGFQVTHHALFNKRL